MACVPRTVPVGVVSSELSELSALSASRSWALNALLNRSTSCLVSAIHHLLPPGTDGWHKQRYAPCPSFRKRDHSFAKGCVLARYAFGTGDPHGLGNTPVP